MLSSPIDCSELIEALQTMNSGTAPGVFGLDVLTLRRICTLDPVATHVTTLLNNWIAGNPGDYLLLTLLTAIPKPDKDPT